MYLCRNSFLHCARCYGSHSNGSVAYCAYQGGQRSWHGTVSVTTNDCCFDHGTQLSQELFTTAIRLLSKVTSFWPVFIKLLFIKRYLCHSQKIDPLVSLPQGTSSLVRWPPTSCERWHLTSDCVSPTREFVCFVNDEASSNLRWLVTQIANQPVNERVMHMMKHIEYS